MSTIEEPDYIKDLGPEEHRLAYKAFTIEHHSLSDLLSDVETEHDKEERKRKQIPKGCSWRWMTKDEATDLIKSGKKIWGVGKKHRQTLCGIVGIEDDSLKTESQKWKFDPFTGKPIVKKVEKKKAKSEFERKKETNLKIGEEWLHRIKAGEPLASIARSGGISTCGAQHRIARAWKINHFQHYKTYRLEVPGGVIESLRNSPPFE